MSVATIAIVGRPNVGKSTLFNRLTDSRQAIEMNAPGTTRDRIYGKMEWSGREYEIIDTGGLELIEKNDPIQKSIQMQVDVAVSEADLIIFLTDGKEGVTGLDQYVADYLRKSRKRVLLMVNKIDDYNKSHHAAEFYSLGMGEPIWLSSQHGLNLDPFFTVIDEEFRNTFVTPEEEQETVMKIAIVGQPNVGKSSLMNRFLNTDRVMVDSKAGTTRDPIEAPFSIGDKVFQLIDTAGIRRVNQLKEHVDKISVIFSEKVIEKADLVLFMLDVSRPLAMQDKRIAGMILDARKPCIVIANKWDTVLDKEEKMKALTDQFEDELYFLKFCPLVTISALTGSRVPKLQDQILELVEKLDVKVNTNHLNHLIREAVTLHQPPGYKGKQLKIYYVTQLKGERGMFVFHVNNTELVHFSFYRYLENTIRNHYGFTGIPIKLIFKGKEMMSKQA